MRQPQLWMLALMLALGCEQVLGLRYTESGSSRAEDSSGGLGGEAGVANPADAGDPRTLGGRVGNGAASAAGQGPRSEAAGAPDAASGGAGSAGAGGVPESVGAAAGEPAGGAPASPHVLDPSGLTDTHLALWLDANVGVVTADDGNFVWLDRSPFSLYGAAARSPEPSRAPSLVQHEFGKYPGLVFDGLGDKLRIADASWLQLGTSPFILELVLSNLTQQCCQQLIFGKERPYPPYPGITVAINWWVNTLDTSQLTKTGEYSTFLQFAPDQVSTPFSDEADYRDGKPRVLSMLRTDSELSIRINGQVLGSIASEGIDASAYGADIVIGGHSDNDQLQFRGSIAEIILARDLETPDALALDRFLVKKYADVLQNP